MLQVCAAWRGSCATEARQPPSQDFSCSCRDAIGRDQRSCSFFTAEIRCRSISPMRTPRQQRGSGPKGKVILGTWVRGLHRAEGEGHFHAPQNYPSPGRRWSAMSSGGFRSGGDHAQGI
jgi:hypothetical protein